MTEPAKPDLVSALIDAIKDMRTEMNTQVIMVKRNYADWLNKMRERAQWTRENKRNG